MVNRVCMALYYTIRGVWGLGVGSQYEELASPFAGIPGCGSGLHPRELKTGLVLWRASGSRGGSQTRLLTGRPSPPAAPAPTRTLPTKRV